MQDTTFSDDDLNRLAHKRAGAKLGWYIHAVVYLAVNILLALLSARSQHAWALFPAFGWGLGLLIHGAVVWLALPGSSLRERLVEQERERLIAARKHW